MTIDEFIPICREAFNIDGTLRDIYVHNTGINEWKKVLLFLSSSHIYTVGFYVDGVSQKLPMDIQVIFHLAKNKSVTLKIDEKYLSIYCHFFKEKEIEFDIDPKNIQNDQMNRRFLIFISTLSQLLNKRIDVTAENFAEHPIFQFDPKEGFKKF